MRLHADPAIGEGRIGGDEFDRRHLGRAERYRGVRLEVRGDAEPMRGSHDGFRPDFLAESHRDRVERFRQRLRQRHLAEIFARIIFRVPALDGDRSVLANAVGRQSPLERSQIDERLERGTGLTLGGRRAIELALGVVSPSDQRLDRALRIERDQGALRDAEFGALGVEFLGQRALSLGLQPGVERGRDDDVLVDRADRVVEHVHDVIGGIIDRAGALLARRMPRDWTARASPSPP